MDLLSTLFHQKPFCLFACFFLFRFFFYILSLSLSSTTYHYLTIPPCLSLLPPFFISFLSILFFCRCDSNSNSTLLYSLHFKNFCMTIFYLSNTHLNSFFCFFFSVSHSLSARLCLSVFSSKYILSIHN